MSTFLGLSPSASPLDAVSHFVPCCLPHLICDAVSAFLAFFQLVWDAWSALWACLPACLPSCLRVGLGWCVRLLSSILFPILSSIKQANNQTKKRTSKPTSKETKKQRKQTEKQRNEATRKRRNKPNKQTSKQANKHASAAVAITVSQASISCLAMCTFRGSEFSRHISPTRRAAIFTAGTTIEYRISLSNFTKE